MNIMIRLADLAMNMNPAMTMNTSTIPSAPRRPSRSTIPQAAARPRAPTPTRMNDATTPYSSSATMSPKARKGPSPSTRVHCTQVTNPAATSTTPLSQACRRAGGLRNTSIIRTSTAPRVRMISPATAR